MFWKQERMSREALRLADEAVRYHKLWEEHRRKNPKPPKSIKPKVQKTLF